MRKVIVTGAPGFLGQFAVRLFREASWEVLGVGRGELAPDALAELVSRERPEALVHLAGPASVAASVDDPLRDFEGSVGIFYSCLDVLRRRARDCRVLYCSSAAVYGSAHSLPMKETDPLRPLSPYGLNKMLCESVMERFHAVYGLRVAAVRVFSAYGEGLKRQLVWDVCRKALSEPLVELQGTGDESRDFVHGSDVARGMLRVLERGAFEGEAYNLATGQETTVRDLAEQVLRHLKVEKPLRFSGEVRAGDPHRWRADVSRISELGYHPEMPIQEGLGRTAAWARGQLA